MHELGIAESVLKAIEIEGERFPEGRVVRAGLKIGELSGVNAESLRFCFEAIVLGTQFESLELEIEFCPRRQRCLDCGRDFTVLNYELRCPQCGSERSKCVGGDELELSYVEVEQHAASGVRAESTQ